jgi:hypothetical protein
MHHIVLGLLVISFGLADPLCPPASPETVEAVQSLLQESERFRTDIGASEQEYQSVEILTDESTCDLITLMAHAQGMSLTYDDPRYRYVYVRSQNYYYIVSTYTPLPEDNFYYLGLKPLIVMNRQFNIVEAIMY